MSWQILNSNVSIASTVIDPFQFSGVHEVRIKKSIHSLMDSAFVTLPSICKRVVGGNSMPQIETTGLMFKDRDPIIIKLGYNGQMQTEFVGFVKRRNLSVPLVVECEGYVQQLRLDVSINRNFTKTKTTAKALLELACQGTDIDIECDVDFPMTGFLLVNANGVKICDYIKEASDHTLTIFFKNPSTLWCGLTYTAYAAQSTANIFSLPTVNYRIGFNTPKDNGLKERIPSEPVQVIMKGKNTDGSQVYGIATPTQVFTSGKTKYTARKLQSLVNHVPDNKTVGKFAFEKAYQANYTGFEGKLTGFLQPYALPGYDAYMQHAQYPELKGTYLIESTDVIFGTKGAKRISEIGPRVGFGSITNIN